MILSAVMGRKAFTLVELLIVVAIIAVLVGAVLPYFENYVKDTKIAKARHELDIFKEALIKYETLEDTRYVSTSTALLIGRYVQNITFDPWGRSYEVNPGRGYIMSRGSDNQSTSDDIIVDYKPPLTLTKAVWIDSDNNSHITTSDSLRLEFTRLFTPGNVISYGVNPNANIDLLFSQEVVTGKLVATQTPSSLTYILVPIGDNDDTIFYPGSSTVQIASGNTAIIDVAGRKAAGSTGEFESLPVIIRDR